MAYLALVADMKPITVSDKLTPKNYMAIFPFFGREFTRSGNTINNSLWWVNHPPELCRLKTQTFWKTQSCVPVAGSHIWNSCGMPTPLSSVGSISECLRVNWWSLRLVLRLRGTWYFYWSVIIVNFFSPHEVPTLCCDLVSELQTLAMSVSSSECAITNWSQHIYMDCVISAVFSFLAWFKWFCLNDPCRPLSQRMNRSWSCVWWEHPADESCLVLVLMLN